MNITGETSNFPNSVDKIALITPYTGATPGSWGDFITPQYVNHIADGVFSLATTLENGELITATPSLSVDALASASATGSLYMARFCATLSDVKLVSVNSTTVSEFTLYKSVVLPTNLIEELSLNDASIESSIQFVNAHVRPTAPINSVWSDNKLEIFPYATMYKSTAYLALLTPTPNILMNVGSVLASFEVVICL